jgi:hypothetical protein
MQWLTKMVRTNLPSSRNETPSRFLKRADPIVDFQSRRLNSKRCPLNVSDSSCLFAQWTSARVPFSTTGDRPMLNPETVFVIGQQDGFLVNFTVDQWMLRTSSQKTAKSASPTHWAKRDPVHL